MRARLSVTRLAPPAAVAVLVMALAACGSASPHAARSTRQSTSASASANTPRSTVTSTTTPQPQESGFSPYTPQGAPSQDLHVIQKVSGHCTNPGVAGSTSYRCTAQPGSMTYDPCFAAPRAATGPLLCVPYPTDTDVTEFIVHALPATSSRTPPNRIWAMQLQNGEVCILVRAAWHGNGPFACPTPGTSTSVADCHTPDHSADGWTVACQASQDATSPFATLPVTNVWN